MSYNKISSDNSITPNYEPQIDVLTIQIAYDYQGNIVIMRYLDGNYISWFYFTTIEDPELEKIIQELLNAEVKYYGHSSKLLYDQGITSLADLYVCNFSFDGRQWVTPLKHGYSISQPEYFSRWIAKDIKIHYLNLINMVYFRTLKNDYHKYLHDYHKIYTEQDPLHYHNLDPLHQLIDNERYLLLSNDPRIRESFLKCIKAKNKLYNQYMSLVR